MTQDSLRKKTVKGASWSALDQIANQGISFLVGIVLARLLTPNEYGLIGIIVIFIAIFNVFINSGFSVALIRKTDASRRDYDTVFVYNLALGVLLFWALWFCAPLIASFFGREELTAIARAMGALLIINAVSLVQTTVLTKEIDFKKQTKISLIASIASGVVGIVMAFMGFGVWALVGQQISRQSLNSLFLWIWSSWKPRLAFYKDSFLELWGFGWKMLVSAIIDTVWKEVYQVVIGKFYHPAALGQYTRAQQFASLFSVNITNVVQRVTYPVLSTLQNNKERLREGYRKVIRITMFVTFCCMLGLAAIAKPMVIVLIGEKWLPSVLFLQLISLNMMLYPLHALNLNMLQVSGRSDLFLRLEIIKKIVAVAPILLGIFWSIAAMLAASIVTGVVAFILNSYYSGRFVNYSTMSQVRDLIPSFGVACAMAVPMWLLSFLSISPFVLLPLQLLVGLCILLVVCETTRPYAYSELRLMACQGFRKFRHPSL